MYSGPIRVSHKLCRGGIIGHAYSGYALPDGLTRISHKVSTAAAQRTMSTALCSLRLLDILFKYACGVFSRAPCIHGPLHRLATKPCEKCGLTSS
jgi:hypothetical protein